MPSVSRSRAVSGSASQLIKLIKSVTSSVLKSHCYSLRFLRKAPTEKRGVFFSRRILVEIVPDYYSG